MSILPISLECVHSSGECTCVLCFIYKLIAMAFGGWCLMTQLPNDRTRTSAPFKLVLEHQKWETYLETNFRKVFHKQNRTSVHSFSIYCTTITTVVFCVQLVTCLINLISSSLILWPKIQVLKGFYIKVTQYL